MRERTLLRIVGAWSLAVLALVIYAPAVYAGACILVSAFAWPVTGEPGYLTHIGRVDLSGKSATNTTLPRGCWPIARVLDVVTSPFQVPLLVPTAIKELPRRRGIWRARAAVRSPRRMRALAESVGSRALDEWTYWELVDRCNHKGAIAARCIPILVDFFYGPHGGKDASLAVVRILLMQRVSAADVRRIFDLETSLPPAERHSTVLGLVAGQPSTSMEMLHRLITLEGSGHYAQGLARRRIRKAEAEEQGSEA